MRLDEEPLLIEPLMDSLRLPFLALATNALEAEDDSHDRQGDCFGKHEEECHITRNGSADDGRSEHDGEGDDQADYEYAHMPEIASCRYLLGHVQPYEQWREANYPSDKT